MSNVQSTAVPLTRLVVIVVGCLAAVASGNIIASADPKRLVIALIFGCTLMLLLIPVRWGILIYFAFSAFSPLLKYVSSYNAIVHLGPDIVLLPILLHWLAERTTRKKLGVADLPLAKLVAAFVAVSCIMVFSPMTTPLVALGGIISYVLPIAFFPLAFTELRGRTWIRAFLMLTLALSTLGAVLTITFVAIGQHGVAALGPGFAQAALDPGTVYYDSSGRSVGWMPLQVVSGVTGYMIALVLLVAFLVRPARFLSRTTTVAGAAPIMMVLAASLIVTGIRMTIAGAAIGVLVVVLAGHRRAVLPTLAGAALFVLVLNYAASLTHGAAVTRAATLLNPGQASQSSGRTLLLQQILPLALTTPLGQGMGRIGPGSQTVIAATGSSVTPLGADNMLVAILSELGIAGGLVLSAIAIMFVVRGWQVYRRLTDPELKCIALGCTAVSVALTSTWFAGPVLMQAPGSIYFWALAGLCFALPHVEGARR